MAFPGEAIHLKTAARTTTAGYSESQAAESEGGIAGFFRNLFGREDSERYNFAVDSGRTVLTADVSTERSDRVAALLNRYGASDVDRSGDVGGDSSAAVPVVDEEFRVGKRSVQRGGVRVYSHVVERPVERQVTLREEHVSVERRPVDRPAIDAELTGLRDQSFEMTETVEEPVIEKRARVTEEVVVGKKTTDRSQTVRDSVRHTDVRVERLDETDPAEHEQDFRQD